MRFNRNILGCKDFNDKAVYVSDNDLIETYWDVKKELLRMALRKFQI